MNDLRETVREFLTPPTSLSRTEQRYYAIMSIVAPISALSHGLFILFFTNLHLPIMAQFNVASVMMWIAVLMLTRRGYFGLSALLGSLEVIIHAVLGVLYVGHGFGYQYALFLAPIIPAIMPNKQFMQAPSLLICAAIYVFLAFQPDVWQGSPFVPALHNGTFIVALIGFNTLVVGYYKRIAETTEAALEVAHAQSEGLLLNILPNPIAQRLKQNDGTIADAFSETSVLFADIADFTPLSQTMTPAEVVQMLDDLFSRFDVLVRKHQLEKIKTIGDAYMVAAGVPTPRPDHAEVMAILARDIQQAVKDYNAEKGTSLRVRIGINSGPVVAGVIGKMRFLYDLWGDSVNTASRMESHGVPNEIQVSEDTKHLLEGHYRFEERGIIDIKGKGPMRTYFLREPLFGEAI